MAPLVLLFSRSSNVVDKASNNSKLNAFTGFRFIETKAIPVLSLTFTFTKLLATAEKLRAGGGSFGIHLKAKELQMIFVEFLIILLWKMKNRFKERTSC